jgi:hypothetical protein
VIREWGSGNEGFGRVKETGIFLASHTPGLIDSLGILQAEEELV